MKIEKEFYESSLNSLSRLGDSDLFTLPVEISILTRTLEESTRKLSDLNISEFPPGAARRFIIPKDELSYRIATQPDPLDSIILTALLHKYGNQIEKLRIPENDYIVFSHRFNPDKSGRLYCSEISWNIFWQHCLDLSKKYSYSVQLDIADFYNQIYHHALDNQLQQAKIPLEAIKWIMNLCKSITEKVSRGIPVGPHASHLLAELSLCPIDNSMRSRGLVFARNIDDIFIFCNSENEAKSAIYESADILDKQQRLILQRHKIRIYKQDEMQAHCHIMNRDRTINEEERELVEMILYHAGGDPYSIINIIDLTDEEVSKFEEHAVIEIIKGYLSSNTPDYVGLRWFIRRLAQVGHPVATKYLAENMLSLLPAISEISRYFMAASKCPDMKWNLVGEELLSLLDSEIIRRIQYCQLSIISLFSSRNEFDNLPTLLKRYDSSPPVLRREIILSAAHQDAIDWLRELKEQYAGMDPWCQRAFLYAASKLPKEERMVFYKSKMNSVPLNKLIVEWGKLEK